MEEKKNGKGKGGKYYEKKYTFVWRRRRTEKEKEKNIMGKIVTGWTDIKGSIKGPCGL